MKKQAKRKVFKFTDNVLVVLAKKRKNEAFRFSTGCGMKMMYCNMLNGSNQVHLVVFVVCYNGGGSCLQLQFKSTM